MASVGTATSNDYSTAGGVVFQTSDFETECKVWEKLEKSSHETILAKEQTINALNALISAQNAMIEALRIVINKEN